jgi:hypothetical protein
VEVRYRGHRVAVETLPVAEGAVGIKVTDATGHNWPLQTFKTALNHDSLCRAALERGLQMIDEACRDRLSFPWDEIQPNY